MSLTMNPHATPIGSNQAQYHPNSRRLSCTIRAQETVDITRRDPNREVIDGFARLTSLDPKGPRETIRHQGFTCHTHLQPVPRVYQETTPYTES